MVYSRAFCITAFVLVTSSLPVEAQDWPQWNGPTQNGLLAKGIAAKPISKNGLELKWKKPIGYGYSGPVVADGRERGQSNGAAYLIKADGDNCYILSETGDFISAKLSPKGYEETGRFHAIDPTNSSGGRKTLWTYPAIANNCLLVRNDEELRCYTLP